MRLVRFKLKIAAAISLAAIFFHGAHAKPLQDQSWSLKSPEGRLEVLMRGTAKSGVEYKVILHASGKKKTAVDWSALGLVSRVYEIVEIYPKEILSDFSETNEFIDFDKSKGVDNYEMLTGKRRDNKAIYKSLSLQFRDVESKRLLNIDFRAYDEGIAFRYRFPESSVLHHQLLNETTEFALGENGVHWGQPYDFFTIYHPSYETTYTNWSTGSSVPKDKGTGWGFPSLFHKNGIWVLLHEAGLNETYQGSHLQPDAPGGVYKIAPPLAEEAAGFGATYSTSTLPWTLPWRFMVVSDDVADIVESNMVFHLSEPSKVENTDWIRPGIASWSWWSDHGSSRNMKALKTFIDLAGEMGWPYSLMDANWNLISENSMEDLLNYADGKGVGLTFWYNSGGRHNFIPEAPRNRIDDRVRRRAEFEKISKLGAKGVKVDFFQSDKQDIIRQYIEILEDAASNKLLAVFHGSTIPRGWARTWPNLMSMEAVQGAEFYTFSPDSDYGLQAPRQNTILPFTRNVIGSMDFTPVSYSHQSAQRHSTNAHETALAVIFESGIQHLADSVETFRSLPEDYREYFTGLPNTWEDTRFLAGAPGEYIVLARRKNNRVYVAGINGEKRLRDISVVLDRWLPDRANATLLFDGDEAGFASKRVEIVKGKIELSMKPFGGFVLVFNR